MSRDAVIVSTARTPLAKSWRGSFNLTHGATLAGHVVHAAIERAGIDAGDVEDVIMGCAFPEGATGTNIARQAALRPLGGRDDVHRRWHGCRRVVRGALSARRRSRPPRPR